MDKLCNLCNYMAIKHHPYSKFTLLSVKMGVKNTELLNILQKMSAMLITRKRYRYILFTKDIRNLETKLDQKKLEW